jgi:hypothetical protein
LPHHREVQRISRRRVVIAVIGVIFVLGFIRVWDLSSQPTSGDGWRLLARQRAVPGPTSATPLADAAALADAWHTLRIQGDPVVDFTTQAVFWLSTSGTIGCPARLDGVDVDAPDRTIVGRFSLGLTAGCDHKVVPDSFLVAIDRDRLPPAPFAVRVIGP